MAISKNGVLGEFSGKVGNVVGVKLKGKNILRSVPKPSKKPPTEKQRLQRLKFSFAVAFITPFMEIVQRFFEDNASAGERKSNIISYVLNHVIKPQEQNFCIEWSKLLLSSGSLSGFHQLETQVSGKVLTILWRDNTHQGFAQPEDEVYLVLASETLEHIDFIEKIAVRSALQTSISLPNWAEKETAHLYIFMNNAENTQSCNSFYLGKFCNETFSPL